MSESQSSAHQYANTVNMWLMSNIRAEVHNANETQNPQTQHQKKRERGEDQDNSQTQSGTEHNSDTTCTSNDPPTITELHPPTAPISGKYTIRCNAISQKYGEKYLELQIISSPFPDSDIFWAPFRWGPFKGIMRIVPGDRFDADHSVRWCVRNLDNDEVHARSDCRGWIMFHASESVEETTILWGELWGLPGCSRVQFKGNLEDEAGLKCDLTREWRELAG